jgi:hypothetical protein
MIDGFDYKNVDAIELVSYKFTDIYYQIDNTNNEFIYSKNGKEKIIQLDSGNFTLGEIIDTIQDTFNENNDDIEEEIIDNKIIYDFKIKYGENLSSKIFEICVLDMVSNISLTIFYFKDTETFYIKDDELENKIDEIISSDKMGDFIGYLILINSKQK